MPDILRPMQGVRIWKNQKNAFTVFELHYTADEEKRDELWKKAAREGMPKRQFLQEYEINWLSYDGIPVYADWNRQIHGSQFFMEPQLGLPLLIGWDFGLNAAAIIGQLQGSRLCVLKEFTSTNMGAERFSLHVTQQIRILWPQWGDFKKDWVCWIDPSGMFRKDTDEGTCAGVLRKRGFHPKPGPVPWEQRRSAVETWLCRMSKEGASLQVNIDECPVFVKGFDGGYRYPQKAIDIEQSVLSPVKNLYSHIHDAFQYMSWGISSVQFNFRRAQVPRNTYGFQKT